MALPMPGTPPVSAGDKLTGREDMGGTHSGQRTTLTSGDPTMRMLGQYGKGAPRENANASSIRGGSGVMRKRISKGGLGTPVTPGVF